MISAIDLSKYIITKCVEDERPISNLQLQKILYFIQREYLKRNSKMFKESIEAWKFGPVVPKAYYYFSSSGAMPITKKYSDICLSDEDRKICDTIISEKSKIPPWKLVWETHHNGGAWEKTYKNGLGNRAIIPDKLMKDE